MVCQKIDISGKVSPYCLLAVQKKARALRPLDKLIVSCDHPASATTHIPKLAQDLGLELESKKISPHHWELKLTKNQRGDINKSHK